MLAVYDVSLRCSNQFIFQTVFVDHFKLTLKMGAMSFCGMVEIKSHLKGYLLLLFPKIRATVFMFITSKYFTYLGSDITKIFTFSQIWLCFLTFFHVSRLLHCLSEGPEYGCCKHYLLKELFSFKQLFNCFAPQSLRPWVKK